MTMFEIIQEKIGDLERCPYLPEQQSRMRYRLIQNCSSATYQELLEHGWRRFGTLFFRPICAACQECRSLRVDTGTFRPNRSMRRTLKKNADLEMTVGAPSVSLEHLELYDRYHAAQSRRKGWPEKASEAFDYFLTFVQGHEDFGHELQFRLDGRLMMVSLVDVLPRALSAVYTYYDPEARRRALGVASVLRQIELATSRGIPHVYLGFWVEGNPSMRYKAGYAPHELLVGRPELDEAPEWHRVEEPPPREAKVSGQEAGS